MIHVGWSNDKDPPGKRVLWITDGRHLGDFYGTTLAIYESEIPDLMEKISNILNERGRHEPRA